MHSWWQSWFRVAAIATSLCVTAASQQTLSAEESAPHFETEVRPILREYCLDCHGATAAPEGGLDLRLARFMLAGGDSGPAITLGEPKGSLVIERVRSGEMPPGEGKVPEEKIAVIEAWIRAGASTRRAEPETIAPGIPITEEERSYWAYQPIRRLEATIDSASAAATVVDGTRGLIRTSLDAIVAKAMPDGLYYSIDANRTVLIQRVFYDLLGLPPTQEQLQHWQLVAGDDWYETMVAELLRSPHYGERWGRHWLDAVGYADSDGSTDADAERAWAWRYRDYVIRSLNADKRFDQFMVEQLAGDELAGPAQLSGPAQGDWTEQQIEWLSATGFLRMAADGTGSGDNSPEARNKTIADTLQIVGSTLLGSSLHCAQCHDHRYDPISHRDYFAIRAVFEPALDWQQWKTPVERLVSLSTAADRQLATEIDVEAQKIAAEREVKQVEYIKQAVDQALAKFEEPQRTLLRLAFETPADTRTEEQKRLLDQNPSVNVSPGVLYQYLPNAAEDLKTFDARITEIRSKKPVENFVQALVEPAGHLPVTRLFHRGDYKQPTEEVMPGGLSVIAPDAARVEFLADDPSLPTTGRRLAFARWLTSKQNPLFARAMVNRVWLHHFGKGIVATPGDFGRLGSQPTHPEVLDLLASQWMDKDWSLKELHRLILTSTVYRQSSHRDPTREAIDPENQYYWRKSLQRMDAEVLRDSVLAISGDLNVECFGAPIPIVEDETGQVKVDPAQPRRSIYVRCRRTQPVAMLQTFDAPVMSINCDVRPVSTVATQSLMMLNGDFAVEQAAKIAHRAVTISNDAPAIEMPSLASLQTVPTAQWLYGTGKVDENSGVVHDFQSLAHFAGSQWQGSQTLPDANIGYVLLHANGGHPGNPQHPAIRRWLVPEDGELTISGTLQHYSENGDGVRARLLGPTGIQSQWLAKHAAIATDVNRFVVTKGQTLDFVLDCLEHETSDSFSWQVTLTLQSPNGSRKIIESAAEFHGPQDDYSRLPVQVIAAWRQVLLRPPTDDELRLTMEFVHTQLTWMHKDPSSIPAGSSPSIQVLTNVCQMLINSNEFLYID